MAHVKRFERIGTRVWGAGCGVFELFASNPAGWLYWVQRCVVLGGAGCFPISVWNWDNLADHVCGRQWQGQDAGRCDADVRRARPPGDAKAPYGRVKRTNWSMAKPGRFRPGPDTCPRADRPRRPDRPYRPCESSPRPLPFPPGSLDVAFSKDSIFHTPDKHALMAEVVRVLKPGGYAFW